MPIPALPILLINRNARNLQLLSEYLGKEGYQTVSASTYEELETLFSQRPTLAGALVDITGFDGQLWKFCEQMRSWKLPFLIVSTKQSAAIQQASLSHGARGVMIKPLVIKEFISIIQGMLDE